MVFLSFKSCVCAPIEKTLPAAKPTVGGKVAQQTNVAVVKGQQQRTAMVKMPGTAAAGISCVQPGAGRRPVAATDELDDDSDDDNDSDDIDDDEDDDIDNDDDSNLEDDDDDDDD